MPITSVINTVGKNAVRKLREQKLKSGLPFMINTQELASNQCYLEHPDGSIQLVSVISASTHLHVIRELSTMEANDLRNRFHLS